MIIKNISKSLLLASLFASLSAPVIAAKKDLNQEITINANRQSADLKNKIASYFGEVSIIQGSIAITADIVQVYSQIDEKTKLKSDTYLAKGKPAIFKQQLEDGSLISLQADEIKYQPDLQIITVSGNAQVKQAGSQVTGEVITYNTLSEKLEAIGSENNSVTTILQPAQIKAQQHKKDNDSNN
ncbi:MAG: lipopolysaccharide transport periplasmic protein LptA [Colwellia sp.]|nr:lipopolysaccharide transport periplasmic protein LptA [Colwellia sp.]